MERYGSGNIKRVSVDMKKVGVIGIVGVPARYGGFETLVENIISYNTSGNIEYTIYCSGKSYSKAERLTSYRGSKLEYIGLKANGVQSIFYDIISILKSLCRLDILLVLGVSGCIILPFVKLFSRKRIIVNIDGLEHRRNKWGPKVRKFLKYSEKLAVLYADTIIADNKAIQDYVRNEYGKSSELIAYGGDHVVCDYTVKSKEILSLNNLREGQYCIAICRIEPENNIRMILEAFAGSVQRIVFIGNWNASDYGKKLRKEYANSANMHLLDPIYDIAILAALRDCCKYYIHGHSAGGTNPSLIEAMFFAKPIFCFDVVYNRETTQNKATYFSSSEQLHELLNEPETKYVLQGNDMKEIALKQYCWNFVAKQYEALF